jgi:exopolysaccharide biosynthesis polyprenyl glycosylphosphotransferase
MMLDLLMICAAYVLSGRFYYWFSQHIVYDDYYWVLLIFCVLFVLVMHFARMYNVTTFKYIDRIITRVVGATMAASLIIGALVFMMQFKETSRLFFLLFSGISCGFVILLRVLSAEWGGAVRGRAPAVLFVGERAEFEQYRHFINLSSMKCKFEEAVAFGDARIDTLEKFEDFLVVRRLDEVVFVYSRKSEFQYEGYMAVCEDMGITMRLVIDTVEMPVSKRFIQSVGTFPVITFHSVPVDRVQLCLKTIFDVSGALIGLVIASPILLITAAAIKLESPGPVFFRQPRVGVNGKVFNILKFRSMYIDAEQRKAELMPYNEMRDDFMFKMKHDPRVTRVGAVIRKYSIDELPQLINVIKREMSLVGTRPPTVDEVARYSRRHRRRISIRPGITGMWQVNGRSTIYDFEQVVALDTLYIDQWTIGLDIKLIWKTVEVLLNHKGAC